MDIKAAIIKNIIYPIVEWKNKSNVLHYLNEYEKTQFQNSLEIERMQWEKMKYLLEHSYENVPFYTERFQKCGIVPSDIRSPADMLLLQPLTKDDIQDNFWKMLSKDISPEMLIEDYTGGSTGKPLKFYYDEQRSQRREASRIRHNRWSCWEIGEKMAVLWGDSSDNSGENIKNKIRRKFINRVLFLDAFNLNKVKMEKFALELEKFKPKIILAYANAIYLLAIFLQNKGRRIYPRGIITSAETLTQEKRDIIESVFKCKVYDRYGSREVGLIASECEKHSGLHVNAENVYVEILKDGGLAAQGEIGEVLVTDLFNYTMPLIRYKIGDVAAVAKDICTCGRGLPLIKSIEGRVSDFIVTPSGKIIHGEYFTHLFYGEDGVQQFQLTQEDEKNIIINFVPSERYSEQHIINIKKQIQDYLGADVNVGMKKVREISKTPSGKYRFTISNLPIRF